MHLSRIFNVENMSFNAIRENKILAKISEFTVYNKRHKQTSFSDAVLFLRAESIISDLSTIMYAVGTKTNNITYYRTNST